VKLSQYWRDMLGSASANDETCDSILNSFPFLPPLLSLPLKVGPLNLADVWGSAASSPSGVWGGAPDKIEFGAF